MTIAAIQLSPLPSTTSLLAGPIILAGTPAAVRQLASTLAASAPNLSLLGCFTTGPGADPLSCPLLGSLDSLHKDPSALPSGATLLLALPLAMRQLAADLASSLAAAGVCCRWLPPLEDQFTGRVTWSPAASNSAASIRIDPTQLLDRAPHPLDEPAIRRVLAGKVVLITGAGGSIGSELARFVARFNPAKLVLVERAENALFEIDREIAASFPIVVRAAVLHDVTNAPGTRWVIAEHRPHIIFHAAAHKHVPMMEDHPAQAVENNFYGTRSIADAAHAASVERFVMISTDKAVNPSSVMGATKRLAELYIQYLAAHSQTLFCMVRFGNVLGSACSVLPIWSQQLTSGGPLTVTHPDMTRYFMTIPEAAGLVLQSAALTGDTDASAGHQSPIANRQSPPRSGEVFLLDMGQPIRIVDLAQRFIRAHGLDPDRDMSIQFTGIRPGEKLFEELAYDGEDMLPTLHQSVRIWRTKPPSQRRMKAIIARFDAMRGGPGSLPASAHAYQWQHATRENILQALHAAIPEMHSPALTPAPLGAGSQPASASPLAAAG